MKAQKTLAVLATTSLLALSVACNSGGSKTDRYQEGFTAGQQQGYNQGYNEGYDDGYADGDAAGYQRAADYFASADYNSGFAAGRQQGLQEGYNNGYTVGKNDGITQGYNSGYDDGFDDGYDNGVEDGYDLGYDDGYDDGETQGFSTGYDSGYSDGEAYGYSAGYDDGYDDGEAYGLDVGYDLGYADGEEYGYDIGYDQGWADAESFYGFSVGKSKELKGYANLLSMVHNDLFDYSKIKAPKQTKRGLVANGKLLLSETSLTNKDTLKRSAAVEQYLVVEMAKQVKGKFGLSAERSLKIAKAANHFRKFSTKRALTAEDTNAYASEILGADFKAIEKAYSQSMKGDLSALNAVLEKAAAKNEVSPEKMGEIMTKFLM